MKPGATGDEGSHRSIIGDAPTLACVVPSEHVETARVPVLRIIARLNVGGPAIQAVTLTRRLAARGFDTTLLRGALSPGEGSMDHLATAAGVRPSR